MPRNIVFVALISLALIPHYVSAAACALESPASQPVRSATKTPGGSAGTSGSDILRKAWYPGWLASKFPPSEVSWSKYNAMTFAFAVTTPDPSVISLDYPSQQALPQMVKIARSHGVSPSLSIGGWTGSIYFSTVLATANGRTAFVKAVVDLANKYGLDGIDFDWEYPNKQGIGCNRISPQDSANFLLFLQELRKNPTGKKLVVSAAVALTPFMGSDNAPMKNVSAFAGVLDHIAIMAYDVWGAWSQNVGPNTPLDDTCAPAPTQAGSAKSAVKAWTAAGFPASQIALGVAAYGHSFHVETKYALVTPGKLAAYPPFNQTRQPRGDSWDTDDGSYHDACGNAVYASGIFNFWGLVEQGFLTNEGKAASGIDYRFDTCSQTPYVYNPKTQVMVSFDDAKSFAAKGQFIHANNLKGFAVWDAVGDHDDILLNSINDAMGIQEECESDETSDEDLES